MPTIVDLRSVDLDELDIAALQVDRRDHLKLDGDHAISVRDTDRSRRRCSRYCETTVTPTGCSSGRNSRARSITELSRPTPRGAARAFSPEELKAQLALCRSELSDDPNEPLDYVPWREHRIWALKRVHDDDLPLPRLCLQPHRFRTVFRSWAAAVEASGGCQTAEGRRAAARTAHPRDAYSRDACVDAVRYVGDRAGGAAMRGRDYDDVARALKADLDPPPDLPAVLPKSDTVARKLGCWPQALHLAGFIDAVELDRRLARVTVALTDRRLLAVMADALRAIGAGASSNRYRRYRAAMRAEHGPRVGLPSLETIYLRLGKWPEATARVLAAFPDIATCTPTWTEDDD